ncbi:MAG TPA: 50S ribosomal protein L3 [Chloroflexi bacterium]|nr:50S ribosomal protein L3 [Chloroflexota bacterium]
MIKGIIGKKVGMTQVFDEDGVAIPVTVIQAGPCWVTQIKTEERDGYTAVQLGFEEVAADVADEKVRQRKVARRLKKPHRGHLGLLEPDEKRPERKKLSNPVPPLRYLREFRVEDISELEEGQKITVEVFEAGDRVDVVGISKGRGFAGTIKRHGFRRQPKTHGQSDRERAPGSIGSTSTPGRVRKGTRMAGRMGGQRVTSLNLEVVVVDPERNLMAVKGSVPGAQGGLVTIRQSVKQRS